MSEAWPQARGWFVLVAGWPGSGKSTVAAALAAELGLPLLAKDEIKEALDSTWFDYALPLARALPGQLAEVHCIIPRELARDRYLARAARRHEGHLDTARSDAELWGEPSRPPGLGPVVPVDTLGPVDTGHLAASLAQALA